MRRRHDADALARQHAPLVMGIALRFSGRAETADLYQAGCVGLLKALAAYDPKRGVAFSTYAVPVITGEIISYLRGNGPVHVPRTIRESASACVRAIECLRGEFGREPTASEVGARTGMSAPDVVFALESLERPRSLDAPASPHQLDSEPLSSLVPDPGQNPGDVACTNVWLRSALKQLPASQRQVIALRFFRGMTQAETAAVLGYSQAHIHRLERAAFTSLRAELARE
ncbi:MAG: RNA polymerase sigma-F factor [Firmicutes bacterium ADurb.Bin506]|nr:MAG: RNA polymerase sigma-F factor [Firmicutes bacterium ADurb.Bin506]